ncbi:NAD(P)H-hydrate epimerase [Quillaja saponaria]|uniref:NAD(P)H-hydrate epimerase n=1 Tax=Quillaja saponaria TaxID=32244 RepID=A0AAD7PE18_QUISA|nr:NAD(P)H-hydrate epimerase [Quillaja saponaria]
MGNWFAKRKTQMGLVHPAILGQDHVLDGVRVKVLMTKRQLKDLMAKVDTSRGSTSELGSLILQECMEGRLQASVLACDNKDHLPLKYARK